MSIVERLAIRRPEDQPEDWNSLAHQRYHCKTWRGAFRAWLAVRVERGGKKLADWVDVG